MEEMMTIDGVVYSVDLTSEWKEQPQSDPDRAIFEAKNMDSGLFISSINIVSDIEEIKRVAEKLKEVRLTGEQEAARHYSRTVTITKTELKRRDWGYSLSYEGHDSSGRKFLYSDVVTPELILNISIEGYDISWGKLRREFEKILATRHFNKSF